MHTYYYIGQKCKTVYEAQEKSLLIKFTPSTSFSKVAGDIEKLVKDLQKHNEKCRNGHPDSVYEIVSELECQRVTMQHFDPKVDFDMLSDGRNYHIITSIHSNAWDTKLGAFIGESYDAMKQFQEGSGLRASYASHVIPAYRTALEAFNAFAKDYPKYEQEIGPNAHDIAFRIRELLGE